MTRAVSVVLPSLERRELLEANLPPLLAELERRAAGDEVLVVDDTGRDALAAWLGARFHGVRCVARAENGGFARALRSGVEAASHELCFSLNTDVRVRPGFLAPLLGCLEDPGVFAAVPRVLLDGDEERVESATELRWSEGQAGFAQPALAPGGAALLPRDEPFPVAFGVGGTLLFRRADFLDAGGFDPLFEPFYWEDIDLCWRAWRAGRTTLLHPASVVEHHHRGTIRGLASEAAVLAAIEKNRWLFQWKHLDGELLEEHLAGLLRETLDAWMEDRRDALVALALAFEQLDEALARRAEQPPPVAGFLELLARSTPRADRGGA